MRYNDPSKRFLMIVITRESSVPTARCSQDQRNFILSARSASRSTQSTCSATSNSGHTISTRTPSTPSTRLHSHRTRSNEKVCFYLKFALAPTSARLFLILHSVHVHRRHRNSLCRCTKPLSRRLRRRYQSRLCKHRWWHQRSAHHEFNGRKSEGESCVSKTRRRERMYREIRWEESGW